MICEIFPVDAFEVKLCENFVLSFGMIKWYYNVVVSINNGNTR